MDQQRLADRRWGLYTASLVLGVFIPIMGGVVEKTGTLAIPLTVLTLLHVTWVILFGLFGLTFFERSSDFIIRCLYYLFCALPSLTFFGSFSGDIGLWLPVSLSIGIFIGKGISDCYSFISWQRIRRTLLGALGADAPLLPIYGDQRTSYSDDSFRARASSGASTMYNSPASDSFSSSTIELYIEEVAREAPERLDGPTDNPWVM